MFKKQHICKNTSKNDPQRPLETPLNNLRSILAQFGLHLTPYWLPWAPFGLHWGSFGSLLAPMSPILAPFASLFAPFGLPFGSLVAPFVPKTLILGKCYENINMTMLLEGPNKSASLVSGKIPSPFLSQTLSLFFSPRSN